MSMAEWEKKEREQQELGRRNVAKLRDMLTFYGVTKVFITYNGGNDECHSEFHLDPYYQVSLDLENQLREDIGLTDADNGWYTDPFIQLGWQFGEARAREVEYTPGSGHFWVDLATGREIPGTHHGSRTYEESF